MGQLLQPYDALSSRFERFIEIALNKFFRSVEIHEFSKSSDSLRGRLFMMQKFGLISSVELWMEMRDFRNRIAHDYLPELLWSPNETTALLIGGRWISVNEL